jgi:hypothetical protein
MLRSTAWSALSLSLSVYLCLSLSISIHCNLPSIFYLSISLSYSLSLPHSLVWPCVSVHMYLSSFLRSTKWSLLSFLSLYHPFFIFKKTKNILLLQVSTLAIRPDVFSRIVVSRTEVRTAGKARNIPKTMTMSACLKCDGHERFCLTV